MPDNNDKLKTLTQAGAVGISILLIFVVWGMIDKGLDVIQANTTAITKLIELIENPRTSSAIVNLLPDFLTLK